MSCVEKETYGRLVRLAPKATKGQVVHAMKLLPFILKSMGETALTTTSDENHTKVRLRRRSRSRSRSRSSSFSRRHRRRWRRFRESSWLPDRRIRVRSSRRFPPVGEHRKTVPEQRLRGRGSRDFPWKKEQRRAPDRDGRFRRWEEGREERRPRLEFRRSSHRLKTTDEATAEIQMGNWKRREKSSVQLLRERSGKSKKTSSESGCDSESKKEEDCRLSPVPSFQRKNMTKTDKTPIHNSEDMTSLSDINRTSVEPIERQDHHNSTRISAGTNDSRRPGGRAGLLPTPGTTAYKAVMERAAILRLRILSLR